VSYEPGLLAAAHRGILYVDEVNLLHDHLVDLLLDAAAMGRSTVEREGVSVAHAARLILIGTMNPEEGELRPQLLDRFGLTVEIAAPREPEQRAEVIAVAWRSTAIQRPSSPATQRRRGATRQDRYGPIAAAVGTSG
jgi:magnesium chelatase subunit D